jgi:hypothetical protein
MKTLNLKDFISLYCERQEQTPDGLKSILLVQKAKYNPEGWMLLECQMLDSSKIGQFTILPFGPNNTFKSIPTCPISPRGLASDMSIVVAVLYSKGN